MAKGSKKKKQTKKKQESNDQTEIYEAWMDFSRDMGEKINAITRESASEYKDLYELWTEYAQKMTDQMGSYDPENEKDFQKIQKTWMDYSDEMAGRFVDLMDGENGPVRDLYRIWGEYSTKMGEQLSELMNESFREQQDLYELWMDSFGMKDKGRDHDMAGVYKDMNNFWLDVWHRSKDMFPQVGDHDVDYSRKYREFSDLWTNSYSKMVMNLIRSPEFAKMDGNILNGNLEMIKQNDKLMNQYLSTMGLPTKESLNDIYLKLHDMDRKISEIARAVNSKGRK